MSDGKGVDCKEAGAIRTDIFFLQPRFFDCCAVDGELVIEARLVRPGIEAAFQCTDCSDVMLTDVNRVAMHE